MPSQWVNVLLTIHGWVAQLSSALASLSGQSGPGYSSLVRQHHRLGSAKEQSTGRGYHWALKVETRSAYI